MCIRDSPKALQHKGVTLIDFAFHVTLQIPRVGDLLGLKANKISFVILVGSVIRRPIQDAPMKLAVKYLQKVN